MKKPRILLVGGGSGGHMYPLLAVAQKIQLYTADMNLDLRYFGDVGAYGDLLSQNRIKCEYIMSSKLRRYFSLRNFLDFFKFFGAIFQSLWKVFWFMPDAVFSKGGPGCLPILLVCRFFGIPVVIHESDSVPGLTNLISGKFAGKVFVAFRSAAGYFNSKNTEIVGNPVRKELMSGDAGSAAKISEVEKKEAKEKLGVGQDKPVLLVLGGSQGAAAINDFVLKNIEPLSAKFLVLHQVGEGNFKSFKEDYDYISPALADTVKNNYKFFAYLGDNLKDAYIASDIALARAGAGTIFELAYFGKPSILIPLPDAANDHQNLNAIEYEEPGATITIEQENFLSHLVVMQLESLISKPDVLEKMAAAARAFYKPLSADKIAAYLLSLGGVTVNLPK